MGAAVQAEDPPEMGLDLNLATKLMLYSGLKQLSLLQNLRGNRPVIAGRARSKDPRKDADLQRDNVFSLALPCKINRACHAASASVSILGRAHLNVSRLTELSPAERLSNLKVVQRPLFAILCSLFRRTRGR